MEEVEVAGHGQGREEEANLCQVDSQAVNIGSFGDLSRIQGSQKISRDLQ